RAAAGAHPAPGAGARLRGAARVRRRHEGAAGDAAAPPVQFRDARHARLQLRRARAVRECRPRRAQHRHHRPGASAAAAPGRNGRPGRLGAEPSALCGPAGCAGVGRVFTCAHPAYRAKLPRVRCWTWRGRGASPGPAHGSHLTAAATAAEERVAAVRLKPRYADARRHVDLLEDFARLRIDPAQLALIGFPGAVPEFVVDPGDAGDEAVRLERAKDRTGLRIDLMDLAVAMLTDPEGPFCPGHSGRAAGRGRYRREHAAAVRVDLLDTIRGDLEQILAVEGGARLRGDIELAHRL